jgi:hypothetical protein
VRQQKHIKAAITAIPEQDWRALEDYPETLIGPPDTTVPTARTIRRRLLSVPDRIARPPDE